MFTVCAVPGVMVTGILMGSMPGTEIYNVSVPALKLGYKYICNVHPLIM